jgi:outer membrane cobalamin receptor
MQSIFTKVAGVCSLMALCLLLSTQSIYAQAKRYTISGYVKEKGSSELLIGVNAYIPKLKAGTSTNTYGFFSLSLPEDTLDVVFSYVGYKAQSHRIVLDKNIELNIELVSENTLREVVVTDERQRQEVSKVTQMSSVEIPVQQIKDLPALLGEKDVMKALQLMPGVQSGSEGNSGLYVRGGGPDQNLIILDDATVYNAYHLFGFFSLFNGDALKSVELTKGGFPARYGGRLSSVVEMNMKEGNKEQLSGEVGIGAISSRFTLEGPLKKGKSSFLVSGRRTYLDALTRPFMPKDRNVGYFFYDLNTKLNYDFGRKNKLYLSGYFGRDQFGSTFNSNVISNNPSTSSSGLFWGNATATARWNHLINEKLFTNTSLIFSNYQFNIFDKYSSRDFKYELDYSSGIRDIGIKYDVDYLPNLKHTLKFGVTSVAHRFSPSAIVVQNSEANKFEEKAEHIFAQESGIYIEDNFRPTSRLSINAGFRLSSFYTEGKHYVNPEPRLAAAYMLRENLSAKASYATMNQYVHLLSNTGIGLPTDLWVPTTRNVAPQQSQQVAAGLAKDFTDKNFSVTLEGYYKKSNNVIGYKEGANFLLVSGPEEEKIDWQDNVTPGQAWSYGMELLLQRKFGRLSGWVGYTLSWSQLQFDSLNLGQKFYARHDRRHDISVVGIYKLSPRVTLSGNWVYGTGNALTLPIASYNAPRHQPGQTNELGWNQFNFRNADDFGARNSFRMAAYHRMDIGIQFHKQKTMFGRPMMRTWDVSVYNAYNRRNPFFYYSDQERQGDNVSRTVLKQVSLFPVIPSISYSLKF